MLDILRSLGGPDRAQPDDGCGGTVAHLRITVRKSQLDLGQERSVAALRDGFDGGCADDPILIAGGGDECASNLLSKTDTSLSDAIALCPALGADPTGPYPSDCADFDQTGVRVPFLAISPFTKPRYVSHAVADHTSLLAFIEKAFLGGDEDSRPHLTLRDQHANTLEDLFDFDGSPSLATPIGTAAPPANDCTP